MSPRHVDLALTARRKDALVRAGYAEILDKGIAALTIDSVVARAGSSKGGALHYFKTKDDLLYAILDWLFAELNTTLDQIAQSDDSPRARLAAELEVLFHSAEVNRRLYKVFFDYVSLGTRLERFERLFEGFFQACRRRDATIIADGIRQQQFRRVNAGDAAAALRALVDGYCLQWLLGADDAPVEIYRDRCRAILGAYLLR